MLGGAPCVINPSEGYPWGGGSLSPSLVPRRHSLVPLSHFQLQGPPKLLKIISMDQEPNSILHIPSPAEAGKSSVA